MIHPRMHIGGNTYALLVGFSLLLLACSSAELRYVKGLQAELDAVFANAQEFTQIDPVRIEQILTGLTLLQLGYTESEVAEWFSLLDNGLGDAFAAHIRLSNMSASDDVLTTTSSGVLTRVDVDNRIRLAMIQAALFSGSSPSYL